jgi:hypothetical protein
MPSRDWRFCIQDMLQSINDILQRTAEMEFEDFVANRTVIKAVLYDLVIARVLDLPLAEVEQIAAQVHQETLLKNKQQTIAKFIELLIHQHRLFAADELLQLEQIVDFLPDDMEVLFQVISRWLERHLNIREAHAQLMASADEMLGENGDRSPQNLSNKQTLQAAIVLGDRAEED